MALPARPIPVNSGPSADQMNRSAADLRDCARRLRLMIEPFGKVLTGVDALATADTWQGPYPDRTNGTIGGWQGGLTGGIQTMLDRAADWERTASALEIDAKAATSKQPAH